MGAAPANSLSSHLLILPSAAGSGTALAALVAAGLPGASSCLAGSLEAGLGRLAAGGTDLVLLEPGLPGGGGLEAIGPILAAGGQPAVILLAEAEDEALAAAALALGAQDCLARPGLDAAGLARSVRRALARREWQAGLLRAEYGLRERQTLELVKAYAIKNLILEHSTLGIAFVRKRKFEWANARFAEIVGLPLEAFLGASSRILYPDDASFREMGRTAYPAMLRGDCPDITWQLQRGDGSLFWCRMIGRPMDLADPDEGSVWMMEDITSGITAEQERLSLEVQLRQAQKLEAIGQLAAGIAHEINTPTQYIGDNTKFLAGAFRDIFRILEVQDQALAAAVPPEAVRAAKEEADLPFLLAEIPKAIEQSMEGIARVSRIVRAMKDFSHPGTDAMVEVDLNRGIESTIAVSRHEWKYVAEVVLELDPALPRILCHPGELNQAMLNLVVNAAHAIADRIQGTEAKGTITVSTAQAGTMAEIRVRDTGTGIPEAIRSRIFDPFFTTKAVGRGTGQGLAIVHNVVVERHKGTLGFETEPGVGSVFIIRLPAAQPAPV